jgi:uncharacterized flavoprotein (TIGR03862 family)
MPRAARFNAAGDRGYKPPMSIPDAAGARPRVIVIGGGPAGLMAAETIARGGGGVTVVDRMASPGRKLLMAGRGGLNLTHSEPLQHLLSRYGAARRALEPALAAFPPAALVAWCAALGQPTFVGSSGRVFPSAMKASPLLRAWLLRLASLGVDMRLRWHWTGWDADGALGFATPDGRRTLTPDATVLALGGASWPRLGSDGGWTAAMGRVQVVSLRPANCGFVVPWSSVFRARFEGAPLKRIALTFGATRVRGEAVVTAEGIEGGAVYALSALLRDALDRDGTVILPIDLRPDLAHAELAARLARPRGGASLSGFLRKAGGLAPVGIGLVQEALRAGAAPDDLATLVKAVPVRLTAASPIGRAISTAGGIALDELDPSFMLRRRPGVFAAGEMLDWEAPTGGYLLQAAFSTGVAAGSGALAWLRER